MAKRIEFVAPVESIRGNMSGRQNLVYAENDNKAFEAPQGQVNYARNYTPRFVGAKRASDGRKYFSVRTKNGVNLTAKSMKAMALLGGTGAIYAAIVNNNMLRSGVEAVYNFLISRTREGLSGGIPVDTTFRQYVSGVVRRALDSKASTITFAGGAGVKPVNINNPWVDGGTGEAISIAQKVLVQFWTLLSVGGIYFYVDKRRGIARVGMSFDTIAKNEELNILGIKLVGDNNYAQLNGSYILSPDGEYIDGGAAVASGGKYFTTDIAPE